MKILLAEDDEKLGKLIVHMLQKEYHTVDWVQHGDEVEDYQNQGDYDLIILDWMLPGRYGDQICKELRNQGYHKGILMLTAKGTLQDRVDGLDAGADDYLMKPFEFAELFARVRSISRRVQTPMSEGIIAMGSFELNINNHTLKSNGELISLTVKEFQLLEILMRNRGRIIHRETLLTQIWGFDSEVTNNSLDALVKLTRKKLEEYPDINIRNIRGVGYKLEVCNVL
ncbi:response regulator transcription factor [Paenibacillus sp.]|uniref:response regulator transcription factor n=1 Tax=Paenibacillus sp. TaxID=58172 RepID=UPI00281D4ACF|nr:response regulator transcription factor [Paenibacillus sp.]MDR0267254.1 response regulator transcription factor [Paenibacillus sp.]